MAVDRPALEALPKVELHVHLEGSIPAPTAIALARSHGEDPAVALPFEQGTYPRQYVDFPHFVRTYLAVTGQVRRPEDLTTVTEAIAREQARQHVAWSEFTFTASTLVTQGWDATAMWEAVMAGIAAVPETRVGLIIDSVRDYGGQNVALTLELVEQGLALGAPIVALGLAGTETAAPEQDFTELRPGAEQLGLGLAIHAGEIGTADNVWRALDLLGAQRIGHGVRSLQDPKLVERLVAEQVVLEVCPTSNVVLGVVADLASHPLREMADAGLAVTVNSDDPPFFSTTLTDELAIAVDHLDLDRDGLARLQYRAVDASFAPADVKVATRAAIDAWLTST